MSKLIVLYGPSASGKSEIQKVLAIGGIPKIITSTTRKPRDGEQDGVHYRFMSRHHFEEAIREGAFLESTQYNGELYGTLTSSIKEKVEREEPASIILDLAGVRSLKKHFPHAFAIYVGADLDSIERRLTLRGGNPEDAQRRLRRAKEVELGEDYLDAADAVVWNSDGADFDETLRGVNQLLGGLNQNK